VTIQELIAAGSRRNRLISVKGVFGRSSEACWGGSFTVRAPVECDPLEK